MIKRIFTFSESKLIFLDGGAAGQQNVEQPKSETPAPTAETVPVQAEAVKPAEKMAVAPDAAAKNNEETKRLADNKVKTANINLGILEKITV
jgi:hypothetical protein